MRIQIRAGAVLQRQRRDQRSPHPNEQVRGDRHRGIELAHQRCGNTRGESTANYRAQRVADRGTAQADAGQEKLRVQRRQRPVGEAHEGAEDHQRHTNPGQVPGLDELEQREQPDQQEHSVDAEYLLAAHAVGDHSANPRRDQPCLRADGDDVLQVACLQSQLVCSVAQDEASGEHVAGGVVAHEDQRCLDDLLRMLAEQRGQRGGLGLLGLGHFLEDRGFLHAPADVVADEDQHEAEQERNAPAPSHELLRGNYVRNYGADCGGQQHACRNPELREDPEFAARMIRRVLRRHQCRTSPLAAGGEAQNLVQDAQENRSPMPMLA